MRTAETDLRDIKDLMERSSRFISLSGLSGVFAGIYALVGVFLAHTYFLEPYTYGQSYDITGTEIIYPLVLIALGVLVLSLLTAIYFTTRNAGKKKQKIWDSRSRVLVWNLFIPLLVGGIFTLYLITAANYKLIPAALLLFYGLALINGSKYTLRDIGYLGYCEIALGILALWFNAYGLIWLGLGFGLLHIGYGAVMYWKYER